MRFSSVVVIYIPAWIKKTDKDNLRIANEKKQKKTEYKLTNILERDSNLRVWGIRD